MRDSNGRCECDVQFADFEIESEVTVKLRVKIVRHRAVAFAGLADLAVDRLDDARVKACRGRRFASGSGLPKQKSPTSSHLELA